MTATQEITRLLRRASGGDRRAVETLFPLVYEQLRAMAQAYFRSEPADHTWQPTALVHEAYLRLLRREQLELNSRREFFSVAAQAMRRLLIEHARKRRRLKRGGGLQRVDAEMLPMLGDEDEAYLLAIDAALDELERVDPVAHQVVMLRYFSGLSVAQVAEVLEVSPATVKRNWVFARAWLHRHISRPPDTP